MFWTVPLADDMVIVDPDAGTARFRALDYRTLDWIDLANSLAQGPKAPATVSFDVQWAAPGKRFTIDNASQTFRGSYADTQAKVAFTSRNDDGFTFASDPIASSTSLFGVVGRERNGAYYAAPAPPVSSAGAPPSSPNVGAGAVRRLPATGAIGSLAPIGLGLVALGAFSRRRARVEQTARDGALDLPPM